MVDVLWLIPLLPILSFLILGIFGRRMSRRLTALFGVGSVGIAAALALATAGWFVSVHPAGFSATRTLWTWFSVYGFRPAVSFRLDALSLVFILVVTFVGFLIHLYSAEFMAESEGTSRFFAYMNLFIGSMVVLVLADNLLFLYLGWEGVGLCSYLLIGFWYKDPANGRAARKAFITTRIGDTALAIGLFLLFTKLGTLDIQDLVQRASSSWKAGSSVAVVSAALLLGGAVGKSAQLPLQTWLPDAMAGPTPVSALIHAATMVTAGVYLIARMHVLFELAPAVQAAVGIIGALTLLLAGFSALVQVDVKRILAYSTISQIGYMFLALGAGAWSAAVFHFVTHAFFKALLFLAAGVLIIGLREEHDIFKMGGLRRAVPLVFWTFLAGSASLSAFPLVTAGFYSKEWILRSAGAGPGGNFWLLSAGLLGAFLTALYTFRMVFVVFFGEPKSRFEHARGARLQSPLVILAAFSLAIGFMQVPRTLGNITIFSTFLRPVFPSAEAVAGAPPGEGRLEIISAAFVLLGLFVAYLIYLRGAGRVAHSRPARASRRFLLSGWGFDGLYEGLFVRPLTRLARFNKNDFIDLPYLGIAEVSRLSHGLFSRTQTGRLRWYVAAFVLGAIIILAVMVFS